MPRMIPSARPVAPLACRRRRALPAAFVLGILPLLAACQDDGPGAADITAAYEAQSAAEREELLRLHGTPEDVPGVSWGFASLRREVELTACEKASDARGYLCVYDVRLFPMGGDTEMDRFSPSRDVEGRVYRVSDGWAVEEIYPDDEEDME